MRPRVVGGMGVRFAEHHLDFVIGVVAQFSEPVKFSAPFSFNIVGHDDMFTKSANHALMSTWFNIIKPKRSFGSVKGGVICA